uniref:cucumber peeling cupredoxin-like n=1 Tax=Erigeron canadensis TaxID=72917 RepID=UPI001CB916D4|nr:cucumber peeling cupredoxin-like [Erigeron canadensis]
MARVNVSLVLFLTMMVASMQYHGTMAQTRHVVGDALGWTIPPGGAAAYTTWASLQTFTVGDILVFDFTNGVHDVAEVSSAAYGPCTATNPISLETTSPASLTLTTAGPHYYICTFSGHCQAGQQLAINVSASSTTMPPSTTPTTPMSPPVTTTPTPPSAATPMTPPVEPCPPTSSPSSSPSLPPTISTTSMPPPPMVISGASSFPAVIRATLLTIGLAFMNL